jgi:hypothetical protein
MCIWLQIERLLTTENSHKLGCLFSTGMVIVQLLGRPTCTREHLGSVHLEILEAAANGPNHA